MKTISLSKGQTAIVDDQDYDWLAQWHWQAQWNPKTRSYYAVRHHKKADGKRVKTWMHRQILGLGLYDPRQGDHVESGRTLDNCRSNLRIATRIQNGCNRRTNRKAATGLKGVTFNKRRQQYVAQIQVNKQKVYLGYFVSPTDAYAAYCAAAKKYHGEFARLA